MFRSDKQHDELGRLAPSTALTEDETRAVSGGRHHKNDTPVGPAPYNVHSSPAGAGPAFYNQ